MGHAAVEARLRAVQAECEAAGRGDVGHFTRAVGTASSAHAPAAPLAQWVPALPPPARAELTAWAAAYLADAAGAYALGFHGDEAAADEPGHYRRLTDAPGPISELLAGYLAHPTAASRHLLHAVASALA
jgi:hypothetical protein